MYDTWKKKQKACIIHEEGTRSDSENKNNSRAAKAGCGEASLQPKVTGTVMETWKALFLFVFFKGINGTNNDATHKQSLNDVAQETNLGVFCEDNIFLH